MTTIRFCKQKHFALTWLRSDIRAGELHLLFAAVAVAVTIVTAIGLFSERLQKALVAESRTFLAADLVLRSPDPVDPQWLTQADTQQLRQAEIVQFPSMVFAGDEMYLASVKAVAAAYPLLGQLEIADQPFTVGEKIAGGPRAGEAWLDSRLIHLLGVKLGEEVWIGEKAFRVRHVLSREPDSGSSYWSLGPRIMISLQDLPATQVVQEGSRVEYRYLFAGDIDALQHYRDWLQPLLQKRHRLLTLQDAQPGLAQSLARAEHFLLLAGSLGVLLAAIAIAMAARRYSLRHFDAVAILKVLGIPLPVLKQTLCLPLVAVALAGVLAGWLLGILMQYSFLALMKEWLPAVLPAASWQSYAVGAVTGLWCVLIFALPLLWPLLRVPPLRILRRELEAQNTWQQGFYLLGALAVFLMMWCLGNSLLLASMLFAGTLVAAVTVALLAVGLLRGLRRCGSQAGSVWRLALANLQRSPLHSILQLVMFSLVLMLLLISLLIRGSLIKEWQQQLPEGTPNQFLINIAPYQVNTLQSVLTQQQIETAGWYPMVRGRLTAINGMDATTQVNADIDELYRELNLTWSATLPEDNQLAVGEWWSAGQANGPVQMSAEQEIKKVSIEKSLAEKLHLAPGDKLTFTIGDQQVDVSISSVRSLAWDRMRPNFYFIFEPGVLENFASTYITSFYLPGDKKSFLNQLLKQFPTLSVFSVDDMIRRIQAMVKQVSQAIELVLILILVAGILVLIATLQASLDQRFRESALLRSLGASRRLILGSLAIEFLSLGALAGLVAAVGSAVAVYGLQIYVFDIQPVFYGWPWLAGPAMGMLVIGSTGLLACMKVVRVSPLLLLQEQAS